MSRKGSPLLTAIGAAIGAWLVTKFVREQALLSQPDFFRDKVVIITGASRGFGEIFARQFAERGAKLVLAARNEDQLKTVAEMVKTINPDSDPLIVPTDVTNQQHLETLVKATIKQFGRLDILVNNAGIRQGGPILDVGAESVHKQLDVNLLAPINLSLVALPHMLEQGSGEIVNISSSSGRVVEPFFVSYGTSKHGLSGFSEGLRRELSGTGVHVLLVNPGYADTDMVEHIGPELRKMQFPILDSEIVVRRTLEGIMLGLPEVNIGAIHTFGGWVSKLFPMLVDLYFRYFITKDFPEAARRQYSE